MGFTEVPSVPSLVEVDLDPGKSALTGDSEKGNLRQAYFGDTRLKWHSA
jgi:hypothetical protein